MEDCQLPESQTDVTELFRRDPLSLERPDIEAIIAKMRESRSQFNLGNMKAGSTKAPTAKASATLSLASKLNLELDL